MVAEYSSGEKKTNFFCNECFKYLDTEKVLIQKTVKNSEDWGMISDEELDEILEAIFNKQDS